MTDAARMAGLLEHGDQPQRDAVYRELSALCASGGAQPNSVEVATACVAPLIDSVLCADASRCDAAEARRAYLVLVQLLMLDDPFEVCVTPQARRSCLLPAPARRCCLPSLTQCVGSARLVPPGSGTVATLPPGPRRAAPWRL